MRIEIDDDSVIALACKQAQEDCRRAEDAMMEAQEVARVLLRERNDALASNAEARCEASDLRADNARLVEQINAAEYARDALRAARKVDEAVAQAAYRDVCADLHRALEENVRLRDELARLR